MLSSRNDCRHRDGGDGYFVVMRAQAFAGEALADIGFAGATGRLCLASVRL